ncbi:MAG TPA: ATP-binding protein [Bradyrhizobium sp.]|nr:ATP-binding protein [Bradyrhizobium sp.]
MRDAIAFLNLKRISGQITALVLASIVTLHLIMTTVFLLHQPDPQSRYDNPFLGNHELASVAVHLLGAATASERANLIAVFSRSDPQLEMQELPRDVVPPHDETDRGDLRDLPPWLRDDPRIFALDADGAGPRIGVSFPDGTVVSMRLKSDGHHPPFWAGPWMMTLFLAAISVVLLSLWAARALTAPLSSFADAAENFSLSRTLNSLPERGPEEVRRAARALNRMHERITGLIDDRTKMLAAISHDLRTPITRMRLRSEFIDDESQRDRMSADLDQMRSMLDSVLSFLRNDRKLEALRLVDIATVLQLIADQFADMGHSVTYVGPEHAMAMVRQDDIRRGITNLVENAVRFANNTTIRLAARQGHAVIDVDDDGPGISEAQKGKVIEPFVRGDDARNMDEASGFGLGLSIARAISLAHGGMLSLHDLAPHGLRARVQFPLNESIQFRQAS